MKLNDLLNIIKSGESEKTEFKRSAGKDIHEEIVALANANGGHILIGVDDNGSIVGTDAKKVIERITSSIQSIIPPPKISTAKLNFDNKDVIVIEVFKSATLCSIGGVAYIRIGAGKRPLSIQEVLILSSELGIVEWDSAPIVPNIQVKKEYIEWFYKKMKESRGKSIPKSNQNRYLRSIGAIKDGKLTNAGLLFLTNSTETIQQSKLRLVFIDGDEPTGNIEFEGPIWKIIEDAYSTILRETGKTELVLSARRRKIQKYPPRVIREAIINAFAHRNYTIRDDIKILIYPDMIRIKNPGGLMPGVDLSDPEHVPRNPSLCNLLYDSGFIERYGYGIKMMRKEVKKHPGIKLEFKVKPHMFEITLKKDLDIILDETDKKILEILTSPMRSSEISSYINMTKPTTLNHLKKLEQLGLVQRIGEGPQTRYKIR